LTRELEERESASRMANDISWELFFPCDLDVAVACPHCSTETHHPFLIYGNTAACPTYNGSIDLPD
ncbi:MAG TPA: hypothetical protein VIV60_33410, partial [Polyangiaceae bacterium]